MTASFHFNESWFVAATMPNKALHATADALGSGRLVQVWRFFQQAGRRVPAVRELGR